MVAHWGFIHKLKTWNRINGFNRGVFRFNRGKWKAHKYMFRLSFRMSTKRSTMKQHSFTGPVTKILLMELLVILFTCRSVAGKVISKRWIVKIRFWYDHFRLYKRKWSHNSKAFRSRAKRSISVAWEFALIGRMVDLQTKAAVSLEEKLFTLRNFRLKNFL